MDYYVKSGFEDDLSLTPASQLPPLPDATAVKQLQRMMDEKTEPQPFAVGEKVLPRFIPIDSEKSVGTSKRQIRSMDVLRIKNILRKRRQKFLVTFEEESGVYDACYFKKVS